VAGSTNPVCVAVVRVEPGVIEGRTQPIGRAVANGTSGGEPSGHMIRVVRSRVIGFVTAVAVGWNGCVVVVHVAVCAWNRGMRAGQREARVVVIEGRRHPRCGVVANIALLRKSYGDVARIVRVLEIRQVARHAGCIGQFVVGVDMALTALHARMGSGQGPAGRGVIERSGSPVTGAMAHFALLRQSGRNVIRVRRTLVILHVATHAGGGSQVVIAVGMALRTLHADMRASERESRLRVIEGRRLPA